MKEKRASFWIKSFHSTFNSEGIPGYLTGGFNNPIARKKESKCRGGKKEKGRPLSRGAQRCPKQWYSNDQMGKEVIFAAMAPEGRAINIPKKRKGGRKTHGGKKKESRSIREICRPKGKKNGVSMICKKKCFLAKGRELIAEGEWGGKVARRKGGRKKSFFE